MERDTKGRFIKGWKFTKDIEEKRLTNMKKVANDPERIKKISENHSRWNKGTKGVMKPNRTSFKKGDISWLKGTKGLVKGFTEKHSEETKIKISMTKTGEKEFTGFSRNKYQMLRLSSKWKIWREFVFLRDNFICQNSNCEYCDNQIGVFLHPHHIKHLSKFPELAFRVDNGITYCKDFHLKSNLHKIVQKES